MALSVSDNIDEAAVLAGDGGRFGGVAASSDLYQERPGSAAASGGSSGTPSRFTS